MVVPPKVSLQRSPTRLRLAPLLYRRPADLGAGQVELHQRLLAQQMLAEALVGDRGPRQAQLLERRQLADDLQTVVGDLRIGHVEVLELLHAAEVFER